MGLAEALEVALGALADIALSSDMTLALARQKAKRIYDEIRESFPVDAREEKDDGSRGR